MFGKHVGWMVSHLKFCRHVHQSWISPLRFCSIFPCHEIFILINGSWPWSTLYKNKGSKALPGSYRPISLLSNVSKVFGRLVKKQLLSFFSEHEVIPDEQFGFLPGRSTVWQLLQVLEEWQTALDNGRTVHALFLDAEKAFDKVDHGLLLAKMRSVGLGRDALMWMSSFLDGRRIRTVVDGAMLEFRPTLSGVPQGSALGPLLFLIYFADLPRTITSSSVLFADDTLLYDLNCDCFNAQPSATGACTVAADTSALSCWAKDWNATFNASKSTDMFITHRSHQADSPLMTMGSVAIPRSTCTRHLGLWVSENLSWKDHVKTIMGKVTPKLAVLRVFGISLTFP